MSFIYTPAKERLAQALLDWREAGSDIRAMLVMTNTTADTDQDAGTLLAITTLDEYSGAGYSRQALAVQAVVRDDPNDRAELGATSPVSFGAAVIAAVRSAQAALIYRHVDGTAANDQPIAFIDTGGFPLNGGGGAYNLAINVEGLLQIA